ncbi:MAG: Glu/Leu/Phe/Val dehydrogenase [Bacillota bacterium]|nr:Glu/Leu/Phe/Val dehydrogenase [Bacillota bacterium]MDW7683155.1 Glu/Leu/Phe/Val dehydrogenase [Bacillota bacterium]
MTNSSLDTALSTLHSAAKLAGLDSKVVELLSQPKRTMEFVFPMRMDTGEVKIFNAYRVHWCDALGPFKDGTRFRKNLTLDELKALALWMTIKHAVGGIPAGGGKGGVVVDPGELSRWELERLSRSFMRHLPLKGAWTDVPGADIGTNAQIMAWMLDEYESITGAHSPAAMNDKPASVSGTVGSSEATGRGVFYVLRKAVEDFGLPKDSRVAVQGFGTVGSHLSLLLQEQGFRVVAISDMYGGIYTKDGINCAKLASHVAETGSVKAFPGTEPIAHKDLLELDVDVLVPAAIENAINEENAGSIRAKLIVEAANGPVTTDAEKVLQEKSIPVIPDVVANVGGAIVCHLERIQGLTDEYWDIDRVRRQLEARILKAYEETTLTAKEMNTSYRNAAWVNALRKIEVSVKTRGWV